MRGGVPPLETEETTAASGSRVRAGTGWIDSAVTRLARLGADPQDDEELRQAKSLLVLLAILILPVSVVWGSVYLAFGSPLGYIPFLYLAVSVGSLVLFARTGNFRLLLLIQLLDVLLTTTAGQMFAGGFLPPEGSGFGASLLRSERSSSSRCGVPSTGSKSSSSSSWPRASQARSSSVTQTSRSRSRARCWR